MRRHLNFLEGKVDPCTGLCAHGLSDWAGPFDPGDDEPVPLSFTCTLLLIRFIRIAQLLLALPGRPLHFRRWRLQRTGDRRFPPCLCAAVAAAGLNSRQLWL